MVKEIPAVKLSHLKNLTDDTGIIQHAKFAVPDRRSGYTVDDNARALVAVVKYCELFGLNDELLELVNTYLSFIYHMQQEDGGVHNYMSYNREILSGGKSEDCIGRVLWACGQTVNSILPEDVRLLAKEVFDRSLKQAFQMSSLRGLSYAILGLYHYGKAFPEDFNVAKNIRLLADRLLDHYVKVKSPGWTWFEPYITYDNARMPQALLKAYELIGDGKYLAASLDTLRFLEYVETIAGIFAPVGSNGWFTRGGFRALYDQQPIEAGCMVEAAFSAYKALGEESYLKMAERAFNWFIGRNLIGKPLYDPDTGGCHDGLTPKGLNLNQGAEATVCYLIARLKVEEFFKTGDF